MTANEFNKEKWCVQECVEIFGLLSNYSTDKVGSHFRWTSSCLFVVVETSSFSKVSFWSWPFELRINLPQWEYGRLVMYRLLHFLIPSNHHSWYNCIEKYRIEIMASREFLLQLACNLMSMESSILSKEECVFSCYKPPQSHNFSYLWNWQSQLKQAKVGALCRWPNQVKYTPSITKKKEQSMNKAYIE